MKSEGTRAAATPGQRHYPFQTLRTFPAVLRSPLSIPAHLHPLHHEFWNSFHRARALHIANG